MERFKIWLNTNWLLAVVVLVGLILRYIGIQYGKPYRYHPDEMKLVYQAGNLLDLKNWSAETFFLIESYPPFFTYILTILFGIYSLILLIFGIVPSVEAVKEFYYLKSFNYHLIGRWFSALIGVTTIPVIYFTGKKLYSRNVGILAACFLAVVFVHVKNSHFGTVDVLATLFTLVSFYYSIQIFNTQNKKYYILAAVFAGLAIATKYNTGLVVLPLAFAHFLSGNNQSFGQKWLDRKIWYSALVLILSFCMACPLPVLDFTRFWIYLRGTAKFEHSGKLGSGGDFFSYFTGNHTPGYGFFYDNTFDKGLGAVTLLLFSLGIIYLLIRFRKRDLLVIVFPVFMYIAIGQMSYKAMRHLLPMVPFLLLISSEFLVSVIEVIKNKKIASMLLILIAFGVIGPQAYKSFHYDLAMYQSDTRTRAKDWVEQNIPEYSRIGMEEFGPQLLSSLNLNLDVIRKSETFNRIYDIYGLLPKMFAHGKQRSERHNPISYVVENNIQYIILDSFTKARYGWKKSAERYPQEVEERKEFYEWIQKNCELLITIRPQNNLYISPEIEIFRVK